MKLRIPLLAIASLLVTGLLVSADPAPQTPDQAFTFERLSTPASPVVDPEETAQDFDPAQGMQTPLRSTAAARCNTAQHLCRAATDSRIPGCAVGMSPSAFASFQRNRQGAGPETDRSPSRRS
jgi:hypothetical protein